MHSAALGNNLEIVCLLISAKADLNAQCCFGDTEVHTPDLFNEESERKEKITQFMEHVGAEYNVQDGSTPISIAAQKGYTNVVTALIAAGADIEKPDSDNRTPLFKAVEYGCFDTARALLSLGANPDAQNTRHRNTPLLIATQRNDLRLTQLLIDSRANVNIQNNDGDTALQYAVVKNNCDAVNKLIKAGANVDSRDVFCETALITAAQHGSTTVIPALLAAKANIDVCSSVCRLSPLHFVAHAGDVEAVKALLAAGADPNYRDVANGITPLDVVIGIGNKYILSCLNNGGGTEILRWHVTDKHVAVAQMLIAAGARLDISTESTQHPLCFATSPIWAPLIGDYKQRIARARQNAKKNSKIILHTLALGLHQRLGKESPFRYMSQDVLQHNLAPFVATALEDQAEHKARQLSQPNTLQ